jgi:hypothetical protein
MRMKRQFPTAILIALTLVVALATAVMAAPPRNFAAPLSGEQEAVPVDTNATGVATFRLSADGQELSYRLNVANIHDVLMAHIHLEASNGPVVVWLYPEEGQAPELIPGRFGGTLATGTITSGDLIGPLAGASVDDLVTEIISGNAYVNVHTVEHPGGEIAGQINRPRGHVD